MIQLVAPWLDNKQLIRLHSRENRSLYDSVLFCLYCKYRYMNDNERDMFLDQLLIELEQLEQGFDVFDTLSYYFEVNIIIITTSPVETKVVDKRKCIYQATPSIIIEKRSNRYHPVGLHSPQCGTQVVFYDNDPDDSAFISKMINHKSSIDVPGITFINPITEFDAKDMFKAYRL